MFPCVKWIEMSSVFSAPSAQTIIKRSSGPKSLGYRILRYHLLFCVASV